MWPQPLRLISSLGLPYTPYSLDFCNQTIIRAFVREHCVLLRVYPGH